MRADDLEAYCIGMIPATLTRFKYHRNVVFLKSSVLL